MMFVKKFSSGRIMSYLRTYKISCGSFDGKYSIETKSFKKSDFSQNINFPIFDTEEQAINFLRENYEAETA